MKCIILEKKDVEHKTGTNGQTYNLQQFWVETIEQYPKKACIQASGQALVNLGNYDEGQEVEIEVNITSREVHSKIYHNVTLRSIK